MRDGTNDEIKEGRRTNKERRNDERMEVRTRNEQWKEWTEGWRKEVKDRKKDR